MKKIILIPMLVILLCSLATASLTTNLKAYYPFDYDANNELPYYNGVLNGGANINDTEYLLGVGSLDCDGNNDYVNISADVISSNVTTIAFWALPLASTAGYMFSDSNDVTNIFFRMVNNPPYGWAGQIGEDDLTNGNGALTLASGTWTHFTITHNVSGTWAVYVNGTLNQTGTGSNFLKLNNEFYLCDRAALDRDYKGHIDELAIWDRELTAAEAALLYNSGSGIQLLQHNNSIYNGTNVFNWSIFPLRNDDQLSEGLLGGEGMQRVFSIDRNKNFTNRLYLTTDTMKVSRSTDSGVTWQHVAGDVPLKGAMSVKSDPNNPDIVWAAFTRMSSSTLTSTEEGIWLSTDGGFNWTNMASPYYYNFVTSGGKLFAIDYRTYNGSMSTTVYAGTTDGVKKTTNGGNTWTDIGMSGEQVYSIDQSENNMTYIFVATDTDFYRIDTTDDSVDTIGSGLPANTYDVVVNQSNANIIYTASSNGVYKSTNAGSSFTSKSSGLNTGKSYRYIGMAYDGSWLYVAPFQLGGDMPYYSDDLGDSWNTASDTNDEEFLYVGYYYPSAISVNQDNPLEAITQRDAALAITHDGGDSWNYSSNGFIGARLQDIEFVDNNTMCFCLLDYGLFCSDDGGQSFTDMEIPQVNSARSCGAISINDNIYISSSGSWSDQDIIYSDDYGASWSSVQDAGNIVDFIDIHPVNSSIVNAEYHYSLDGGLTWTSNGASWRTRARDPSNPDRVLGIRDFGSTVGVAESFDNGATWTQIGSSMSTSSIYDMDVDPFNSSHYIVAGGYNGVYEYTGGSWALRDDGEGLSTGGGNFIFVEFDPTTQGKIWTGKQGYRHHGDVLGVSLDDGKTWTSVLNNLGSYQDVYNVKVNPFTTDVYMCGPGIYKGEIASTSADTSPPSSVTNITVVEAADTYIITSWQNPLESDFDHVEVWYNNTDGTYYFFTNVTKPGNSVNVTGLSTNTYYTFTYVPVDTSGNEGTNTTITETTVSDLIYPRSTSVAFNWTQKPYIINANISINYSNIQTLSYVSDADSLASSAIDNPSSSNDDNLGTGAGGQTGTGYLNHTFTSPGTNFTYSKVQFVWYGTSSGDYIQIYCYDHDTSTKTYITQLTGNGATTYSNITLEEGCTTPNNDIILAMTFHTNAGQNTILYETKLFSRNDTRYEIHVDDELVFTNYSISDNNYLVNITNATRTSVEDDLQTNISFFTMRGLDYDYNISIDYIYNKSINVSIYANGTTTQLNASCVFNGQNITPMHTLLPYNSSLTNQLNCTFAGYQNLSEYITPEQDAYNLSMYSDILVLSIYDEDTDLLIDTENITLTVISDSYAVNLTTNTGLINISGIQDTEVELRYGGSTYRTRRYFITTTQYQTQLDLYTVKISNSSLIVFNAVDEKGQPVTDAILKVQRYFLVDNAYLLVGMERFDDSGISGMYLRPFDVPYIVIVEKNNEVVFRSAASKIFTDTVQLQMDLLDDALASHIALRDSITTNLSWNNNTKLITYFFNNPTGLVVEGCVEVYGRTYLTETLIGPNCTSSSSATIVMNLTNLLENNTAYTAKGYVETSTTYSTYFTDILPDFMKASTIYENFGNMGLYLAYIFIITMFFLGLPNFSVAMGYSVFALVILNIAGITFFGVAFIIAVTTIGLVISKANQI
jgi:hypothetical protein